jgi:hypothetical protein
VEEGSGDILAMFDRACPLGFIVFATFTSALVWLYALVHHVPLR